MNLFLKACLQTIGWSVLAALLAPMAFSVWVSFSPDSFLTPPGTVWSLRWYREFWLDPRWHNALLRSLIVAISAASLALFAGLPLAIALKRLGFSWTSLLEFGVMLPALVPPVALGLGILFWVQGTIWQNHALIPAHTLLALPVVLLILQAGLTSLNPILESAARGLGASPFMAFLRITLPLIFPSILSAGASAFVMSLNESMLAIFLTNPGNETLPAVAWPQLRHAPTPLVAVASCASVAITMAGMGLGIWIWSQGKKMSRTNSRFWDKP